MAKFISNSFDRIFGPALFLLLGTVACNTAPSDGPGAPRNDPEAPLAPSSCRSLEHSGVYTLPGDEALLKERVALVATDGSAALFFSERQWDGDVGAPTAALYQTALTVSGEPNEWSESIDASRELSPIGGRGAEPFPGNGGGIDVLLPRVDTLGEHDLGYGASHLSGEWRLARLPGAAMTGLPEEQTDLSTLAHVGRAGFVLTLGEERVVSLVDGTTGKLVLGKVTADGALHRLGELGCEIPFDGPEWTPAQVAAVQVGEAGAVIAYACEYSGGEMGLATLDGDLTLHDLGKPPELTSQVVPRLVVKPGSGEVWLLTRDASAIRSSTFLTVLSPHGEIQAPPVEIDRVTTFIGNAHVTADAFAGGLALVTVPYSREGLRVSVLREGLLPTLEVTVPTEGEVGGVAVLPSPDGTQMVLAWTDQRRALDGTFVGSHVNVARVGCSAL